MTPSRMAMLVMLTFAPLCASGQVIPAGTSPEKIIRLEAAEKRVDAIVELYEGIRNIDRTAYVLERERGTLQRIPQQIGPRNTAVGEAKSKALACLERRRGSAGDVRTALSALNLAIAATHESVRSNSADRRRLKGQIASFDTRRQRELDLEARVGELTANATTCQMLYLNLHSAMGLLRSDASDLQSSSTAFAKLQEELRAHAVDLNKRMQRAVDAGWFNMPPGLQLPDNITEPVRKLSVVASAMPAVAPRTAIDLRDLQIDFVLDTLMQNLDDATRAADANAYLHLPSLRRVGRCSSNCYDLDGERAQQGKRLADAYALFQQRQSDLAAQDGLALSLVVSATTGHTELYNNALRLVPLVDAGTADIARSYGQAKAWGPALLEEYWRSVEAARDERQAALAGIYGSENNFPPPTPVAAVAAPPPVYETASPVRGHVYEVIQKWNLETPRPPADPAIANFGSYTYVLFHGAPEFEPMSVRQRYQKLLVLLHTLPTSGQVTVQDRKQFNLFVIPGQVRTGPDGASDPIAYQADLGNQWKIRAQGSILMHPTMLKKLTSSPGPFLLTLPTRIALANSSTPALFADLDGYSIDAVTDLVNEYMGGMLLNFPKDQKVWRPAIPTRVALTMISLANNGSDLAFKLFPASSAHAAPR